MSSNGISRLVGQLEGAVYRLDTALMKYARSPSNENAADEVEKASLEYEAASAAVAAKLLPAVRDGAGKELAAARYVALIGLDAGVALHSSEVAALVQEPAQPEASHVPRIPTEAQVNAMVKVRCADFAQQLLPEIRGAAATTSQAAPGTTGSMPSPSVSGEVDALVARACDDMRAVFGRAALGFVPTLAAVTSHLCNDPTGFVDALKQHVTRWFQVARRAAARAWGSALAKLSDLVGVSVVSELGGVLTGGLLDAVKGGSCVAIGKMLHARQIKDECDGLIAAANDAAKVNAAITAAQRVCARHAKTKWIGKSAYALPLLTPLHFVTAGITISIVVPAGIVLIMLAYVLAHDFLDSDAPPPLPNLFKGIFGEVSRAVV